MALIDNIRRDDWEKLLRIFFEDALHVIKNDPHQRVGSSVDDLISWLHVGGISGTRFHLKEQMKGPEFSEQKRQAVMDLLEILFQENRSLLMELAGGKSIPLEWKTTLLEFGISEMDIGDLWTRIIAGERPFADWMHAHDYSDETIAEVYRVIDEWLLGQGIRSVPPLDVN